MGAAPCGGGGAPPEDACLPLSDPALYPHQEMGDPRAWRPYSLSHPFSRERTTRGPRRGSGSP